MYPADLVLYLNTVTQCFMADVRMVLNTLSSRPSGLDDEVTAWWDAALPIVGTSTDPFRALEMTKCLNFGTQIKEIGARIALLSANSSSGRRNPFRSGPYSNRAPAAPPGSLPANTSNQQRFGLLPNKFGTKIKGSLVPKMQKIGGPPGAMVSRCINLGFQDTIHLTSVDLEAAYYQVPLAQGQSKFLGFIFDGNIYQGLGLPFGSKASPSIFVRIMNLLWRFLAFLHVLCFWYMDDSIIIGLCQ